MLYRLGGSSGGARPKILTEQENKDWMIKFPAHVDSNDIGMQEYDYANCAKKCGIAMTETKLFPSDFSVTTLLFVETSSLYEVATAFCAKLTDATQNASAAKNAFFIIV